MTGFQINDLENRVQRLLQEKCELNNVVKLSQKKLVVQDDKIESLKSLLNETRTTSPSAKRKIAIDVALGNIFEGEGRGKGARYKPAFKSFWNQAASGMPIHHAAIKVCAWPYQDPAAIAWYYGPLASDNR